MLHDEIPPLTDPMKLVLEQKMRLYNAVTSSNQKLDERADRLIQTGSIIIGLGALANTRDGSAAGFWPDIQLAFVVVGFVLFVFLVVTVLVAFRPIIHEEEGTSDWDLTYNAYVNSPEYFNQILSDLVTSIRSHTDNNARKSTWLQRLLILLVMQVITLSVAWLIGIWLA